MCVGTFNANNTETVRLTVGFKLFVEINKAFLKILKKLWIQKANFKNELLIPTTDAIDNIVRVPHKQERFPNLPHFYKIKREADALNLISDYVVCDIVHVGSFLLFSPNCFWSYLVG